LDSTLPEVPTIHHVSDVEPSVHCALPIGSHEDLFALKLTTVNSVDDGLASSVMQFPGTLKNTRSSQSVDCPILFDSGATACFLHSNVCSALHLTVHTDQSSMSATTADGRDVTFAGYAYVSVHLDSFACVVKCWVGDIGAHCLILGDTFFVRHQVILDWGAFTATLKSHKHSIVLQAEKTQASPGFTPSRLSVKTITAKHFAKLAAKPHLAERCFMVRVTHTSAAAAGTYSPSLSSLSSVPHQQATPAQHLPTPPSTQLPVLPGQNLPQATPAQFPELPQATPEQPPASTGHAPASTEDSSAPSSPFLLKQAHLDAVLHDFQDLFPDDLPHLAPHREFGNAVPTFTIPVEPNTHPPNLPHRRLSPAEALEVDIQLRSLLQKGLIEPSSSPYGAPVLFVAKKDGSLRMCIDYRALNKITVKNRYPIPRIDDLLDQLNGAKVFSSLDLMSGYWQIRMDPADVPKTAFRVPQGHYQWKVMPFGLTNAPAKFQSVMNTILRPLIGKCVLVYLDDILIFSRSAVEHEQHLRQVFSLLRHYKFYCKLSKCDFNKAEVKYLGHVVGADGVKVDPAKTATIADWPTPQTPQDIRQFLGLANYFRRFIKGFATMSAPLTALLKGHSCAKKRKSGKPGQSPPARPAPKKPAVEPAPFVWTAECQQAFDDIKWSLTHAPVLAAPVLGRPFTIVCDASQRGVGALLLQDDRPIAYESRKLTPAELNYHPGELEMLAVIHALHAWRCYVEGVEFTLMTDHSPNTFFATKSGLSKRQARWQLFLQLFDKHMTWKYIQGKLNIADPLSRLPDTPANAPMQQLLALVAAVATRSSRRVPAQQLPEAAMQLPVSATRHLPTAAAQHLPTAAAPHLPEPTAQQLPATTGTASPSLQAPTPTWLDRLKAGYKEDPYFKEQDNRPTMYNARGVWYHARLHKVVVPFQLRMDLLHDAHSSLLAGHFGIGKTTKALQQHYWWPGLRDDVTHYIATCPLCSMNKVPHTRPAGLIQPLPVPPRRFGSISMDFIGELPDTSSEPQYNSILVIMDRLTKMAKFIPCHTTSTADDVARLFVAHWVSAYGLPDDIVSDRDKLFTSRFWRALHTSLGIKLNLSTSFHPQTDGGTERLNRTLQDMLRCYVNPRMDNWDTLLPNVQFAYNSSHHSSIGMTPFKASMGFVPKSAISLPAPSTEVPAADQLTAEMQQVVAEVQVSLEAARQRQISYANAHRSELLFEPGQRVWLSTQNLKQKVRGNTSKLTPKYWGPFLILRKVGPVAYELDLPSSMKVHRVFHVSLLKQYHEGMRIGAPPPAVVYDDSVQYEVDAIMDHKEPRSKRGKRRFLIKWLGYGHEHNSWEPEDNLEHSSEYLTEYWDRFRAKRGRT
jgi:Reverse transcriptase (RNA-dependent DNA polymerase)/RNase H-like domain found in reverse transcriptase/Integrase zinc binding domain/Chromo (CHRromatin Organisation MOdifier) domain